ncbi:hypothetical protein R5R35_014372 [Gryllus longicercus]|uniref:F-box only protein 22 n=1 Tax=Gryllus longicercus TaxID=2509291 RepID=A0AAN9VBE5_9ORTH
MPRKRTKRTRKSISNEGDETISAQNAKEQLNGEEEAYKEDSENISMLGHYITKEYELLRLVLSYLPLRDLNAAAQVCKTWQSAVDVIKRSRHARPQWLFWHSRQKEIGSEELPHHLFSRHFFSEPQLCLMFMTHKLTTTEINCRRAKAPCPCGSEGKHNCNMKHRILHYMRAELSNCPCVLVEGFGVVGTSNDLSFTAEIEGYNAYSGLLLPKTPSISVNVFHFTKEKCIRFNLLETISNEEIKCFTKLSPSTEPIRCLLLFCRENYSHTVEKLVPAIEASQGSKFAVGGGFFDSINVGSLAPMNERRHVCLLGIALSGEGIHAASTVLRDEITDQAKVIEVMEELRSCQLPGQDSAAFMFACCGRGRGWYMEDNVESACFRHLFPTTPLVGYFGAGEIGHKFFPETCLQERQKGKKPPNEDDDDLIRSYTTVFVGSFVKFFCDEENLDLGLLRPNLPYCLRFLILLI